MNDSTGRILIVGLGNADRGDDGLGPRVVAELAGLLPNDVVAVTTNGDVLGLASEWTAFAAVICIDAATPAAAAGRIHRFDLTTAVLPPYLAAPSSHCLGLAEAIALARALHQAPKDIIVYAVEGGCFDLGAAMTPEVSDAVAHVANRVIADVHRLREEARNLTAGGPRVETKIVEVAGVDLELFETSGSDGSQSGTVLFAHSGQGYDPWRPFAEQVAGRRRLIAPSHPGFGKSSLPDWLDSIDDIAHLYLELLDRLELKQVDVVGCSVGGWIAAEMASKVPERFRRLVLIGPTGVKVGPADKLDIPDLFAMPQAEIDKLMFCDPQRMVLDLSMLSDDELVTVFRNRETLALLVWEPWMHNPKLKHRLHRIGAPALFIRGESDGVVSADYLAAYAKLLPNARTLTIAEAGHLPHLEQPGALASAIHTFLET